MVVFQRKMIAIALVLAALSSSCCCAAHPRILTTEESSDPTTQEHVVHRTYQVDFALDLYGMQDVLSKENVVILEQTTRSFLNDGLDDEDEVVEVGVSSVIVVNQEQTTAKSSGIPILSVHLVIAGEAVSTNVETLAKFSFQNAVLEVFATSSYEFIQLLQQASDAFEDLLVPRAGSVLEPAAAESLSSSFNNLIIIVSASVGAALLTALVLWYCLFCTRGAANDSSLEGKEDKQEDDLDIASTWSSSTESSEEQQPPNMRAFPMQESRRALSPCPEAEEGTEASDDSTSKWTYSSTSGSSATDESSDGSCDAESVKISLSMQSIDEFEASICSTPRRRGRMLLEV